MRPFLLSSTHTNFLRSCRVCEMAMFMDLWLTEERFLTPMDPCCYGPTLRPILWAISWHGRDPIKSSLLLCPCKWRDNAEPRWQIAGQQWTKLRDLPCTDSIFHCWYKICTSPKHLPNQHTKIPINHCRGNQHHQHTQHKPCSYTKQASSFTKHLFWTVV